MRLALLMILCALAWPVSAGPWPRDKGHVFLSTDQTIHRDETWNTGYIPTHNGLYAELGLGDGLTLGFDGAMGQYLDDWVALVFLRLSLPAGENGHRLAGEVGLGTRNRPLVGRERVLRAGASWGYGMQKPWHGAWVSLEGEFTLYPSSDEHLLKLDGTLGVKPGETTMLIAQLQSGATSQGSRYLRFEPSAVYRLSQFQYLVAGLSMDILEDDRIGLKMGSWFEF
ncbi:hypothetical protein C8N32_101161 [Rhodovulum imhoffii]|uniref:Uncharacterized protein n=1 Tax=Rhodovulum imhoffii TaxID=365340 RepID=A0A2T5BWE3_9RHOB|nr:hypothetical protein [Rhodovulum imhoffii]MBK5935071.1 hypothetical protein [Rhodovulum imhoffii]PTN03964.1 hypothetical protein C8N32_101161 [Rhodovulum imhoffii]